MLIKLFSFSVLLIYILPIHAKVYKCDDEGVPSYSSQPCENRLINLEIEEQLSEKYFSREEQFIAPEYPGWKEGWKKTKDFKLARFSEVVYEPLNATELNKSMRINKQKLTDIPQSLDITRFSKSVDDILQSLCSKTLFIHSKIDEKNINQVLYGQYACSFRRDTQQGELGHYKIMRGENSIYMMTVKWDIEPFDIEQKESFELIKSQQQTKFKTAQDYLQKDVRLCRDGKCL